MNDDFLRILEWTARALSHEGIDLRITIIETIRGSFPIEKKSSFELVDDAVKDHQRHHSRKCKCGKPTRGPRYSTCGECGTDGRVKHDPNRGTTS